MYINIDPTELEKIIKNEYLPIIVYFYGSWCAPCKKVGPIFESLASELEGFYKFAKVTIDDEKTVLLDLKIRYIPTILFFKDEVEVSRLEGFVSREQIQNVILEHF